MSRKFAPLLMLFATTGLLLGTIAVEAASPRQSALNTTITDSSIAFGGGVGAQLSTAQRHQARMAYC